MLFSPEQLQQMAQDRREDDARLAAAQVTQAWRERGRRVSSLEDSPLFSRQQAIVDVFEREDLDVR